jgi:hypothetical protein
MRLPLVDRWLRQAVCRNSPLTHLNVERAPNWIKFWYLLEFHLQGKAYLLHINTKGNDTFVTVTSILSPTFSLRFLATYTFSKFDNSSWSSSPTRWVNILTSQWRSFSLIYSCSKSATVSLVSLNLVVHVPETKFKVRQVQHLQRVFLPLGRTSSRSLLHLAKSYRLQFQKNLLNKSGFRSSNLACAACSNLACCLSCALFFLVLNGAENNFLSITT